MKNLKELITSVLYDDDDNTLNDSVQAMQDLYVSHTGVSTNDLADIGVLLPSGLAISPLQAAVCLMDVPRTTAFLRGVHKALLQLRKDAPGRSINVLYAGCGPYATLLTPFTAMFSSDEVAFYMLDISQPSLDSVRSLYSSLGASDHIKEYICADASAYRLPEDVTMDLVISETMQRALFQEPQVAIMLNLIPQMANHAIFIPEEISVGLKLISRDEVEKVGLIGKYDPETVSLGALYTIGRQQCKPHEPCVKQIPAQPGKLNTLCYFTDIVVFADEQLHAYNCTLNSPVVIADITENAGKKICFQYDMSSAPEFRYGWIG